VRVERIELVSAYRRDPAVYLTKGPAISAIAGRLSGEIITVNTPEHAPPELPRLVIRFERAVLQIGLNRFHFVAQPPTHVASSFSESLTYAASFAEPVFRELFDGGTPAFEWTGIVATLSYPVPRETAPTGIEAAGPVYKRLTNLSWNSDELASFDLRVGRRINGFYRNYSISGYQAGPIAVEVPAGATSIEIDVEKVPALEVGVSISLDVNSKPTAIRDDALADFSRTVNEARSAFESLVGDLNLGGIL
jgi:hypothetical protein